MVKLITPCSKKREPVNLVGFLVIHVSQVSVVPYITYGGMSTQRCIANFLQSLSLKEFLLADRTVTQYDRLLPAGFCPSVCPSVTLCIVALTVGVRG